MYINNIYILDVRILRLKRSTMKYKYISLNVWDLLRYTFTEK